MTVFVLFLMLIVVSYCELYGPTDEEWKYAFEKAKPREIWGQQARKERSLRLFILGGSNTKRSNNFYDALVTHMKNSSNHIGWKFESHKLGISGVKIGNCVGMKLAAVESLPLNQWPNVVLFEFSVNLLGAYFTTAHRDLDALVNTINLRYDLVGLPRPDYGFLELFNVHYYIDEKKVNASSGLDFLNQDVNPNFYQKAAGKDGCGGCPLLRSFASFYSYPTISWRDAGYPAFVRYFTGSTKETFDQAPWNYTLDGQHLTEFASHELVHRLIAPFFSQVMAPRKVERPDIERSPYGNLSLRLTQPQLNPLQLEQYAVWKEDFSGTGGLDHLIRKPPQWTKLQRHHNHLDASYQQEFCYGSFDRNAPLLLDFDVPSLCNSRDCRMSLTLLHSWNASLIGSVSCYLNAKGATFIKNKNIDGQLDPSTGAPMTITSHQKTMFNVSLVEGRHELVCRKLDSKLSCLVAFDLSTQVML